MCATLRYLTGGLNLHVLSAWVSLQGLCEDQHLNAVADGDNRMTPINHIQQIDGAFPRNAPGRQRAAPAAEGFGVQASAAATRGGHMRRHGVAAEALQMRLTRATGACAGTTNIRGELSPGFHNRTAVLDFTAGTG